MEYSRDYMRHQVYGSERASPPRAITRDGPPISLPLLSFKRLYFAWLLIYGRHIPEPY